MRLHRIDYVSSVETQISREAAEEIRIAAISRRSIPCCEVRRSSEVPSFRGVRGPRVSIDPGGFPRCLLIDCRGSDLSAHVRGILRPGCRRREGGRARSDQDKHDSKSQKVMILEFISPFDRNFRLNFRWAESLSLLPHRVNLKPRGPVWST